MVHDLFVDNLVHELKPFDGLLLCDANVLLLQGHRPETVVEKEESILRFHSQEGRNVLVVRQGSAEADEADIFLWRLYVTDSPVGMTLSEMVLRAKAVLIYKFKTWYRKVVTIWLWLSHKHTLVLDKVQTLKLAWWFLIDIHPEIMLNEIMLNYHFKWDNAFEGDNLHQYDSH